MLGRRGFLPRITFLRIVAIIIGKDGLNLIPELYTERFELIAVMTLLVVGFFSRWNTDKKHCRELA